MDWPRNGLAKKWAGQDMGWPKHGLAKTWASQNMSWPKMAEKKLAQNGWPKTAKNHFKLSLYII